MRRPSKPKPLRDRMAVLGITDEQLAAHLTAAGLPMSTDGVRNVVTGNKPASADVAACIAKALGIPPEIVRPPHRALVKIRPLVVEPPVVAGEG